MRRHPGAALALLVIAVAAFGIQRETGAVEHRAIELAGR
jgi:hypothetical protein